MPTVVQMSVNSVLEFLHSAFKILSFWTDMTTRWQSLGTILDNQVLQNLIMKKCLTIIVLRKYDLKKI